MRPSTTSVYPSISSTWSPMYGRYIGALRSPHGASPGERTKVLPSIKRLSGSTHVQDLKYRPPKKAGCNYAPKREQRLLDWSGHRRQKMASMASSTSVLGLQTSRFSTFIAALQNLSCSTARAHTA